MRAQPVACPRRAHGPARRTPRRYTIGNIVSLSGSCFLFGPRRQARQMFEAKRAYATAIYLAMMVRTDWTNRREPVRARSRARVRR